MKQYLLATRTLHLLLLSKFKTLDESVNIPLISLQFLEKSLRLLIGKETIEIITLSGKESVKIDLPALLLVWTLLLGFFFLLDHASFFIGYSHLFCQLATPQSHRGDRGLIDS